MIHVLITGVGSYLGRSIAAALPKDQFAVRELDVRSGVDSAAFRGVDAVVHVAGIAHRAQQPGDEGLYQSVNCDLAVQTARIARENGVSQFVFFSSMSVYGMTQGHITADTPPAPNTFYGKSKWAAEQQLGALADERFRVAVLRPPMIYGKGCRGNYPRLAALARRLPVFPRVRNRRSMLYIETTFSDIKSRLISLPFLERKSGARLGFYHLTPQKKARAGACLFSRNQSTTDRIRKSILCFISRQL